MSESNTLKADDLYTLARSTRPEDRAILARTVTNLLQAKLSGGEMKLVQDILLRLLREAERSLRKTLADYLVAEENCPQPLLDYLIFDLPFTETQSLLKNASTLKDDFLIEVCKRFDHPRYWRTIATRQAIGSELALYLIGTNDNEVHELLIHNEGAELSPPCMAALTDIAINASQLQEPLLKRPEITDELAAKLYWHVSEKLRADILGQFQIDQGVLDKAVQFAVSSHINKRGKVRTVSMEMLGLVKRMPYISTRQMIDAMEKGDRAMFAYLCGVQLRVNPENILQRLEDDAITTLAVLCRAFGLTRNEYNDMYLLWRRGMKAAAPNEMVQTMHAFNNIKQEQARATIETWEKLED